MMYVLSISLRIVGYWYANKQTNKQTGGLRVEKYRHQEEEVATYGIEKLTLVGSEVERLENKAWQQIWF